MKTLYILLLASLISCSMPTPTNKQLSVLKPPIIAVSIGTSMGDCVVQVVDPDSKFVKLVGAAWNLAIHY